MLTNQRQTKRLRKEIVVADESDVFMLKPRMTDHLRVSKLTCSSELRSGRDSGKEAEYVEGGSVAMRSGAVKYSRDRPVLGHGFGPKKTDYVSDLESSETFSLPNIPSKDTNLFYKKAMRNSSELAEPRRLPTACFGLERKQQTESYATQVVDSQVENRGAQATRQTTRKLNPFVEECEAPGDTTDCTQRRHAFRAEARLDFG